MPAIAFFLLSPYLHTPGFNRIGEASVFALLNHGEGSRSRFSPFENFSHLLLKTLLHPKAHTLFSLSPQTLFSYGWMAGHLG